LDLTKSDLIKNSKTYVATALRFIYIFYYLSSKDNIMLRSESSPFININHSYRKIRAHKDNAISETGEIISK